MDDVLKELRRLQDATQHEHVTTADCGICLNRDQAAVEHLPALLERAEAHDKLERVLDAARHVVKVSADAGEIRDTGPAMRALRAAVDDAEKE
jgi:hypothetical protein